MLSSKIFSPTIFGVIHKFLLQATANLVPLSATRVAVKFDSFKIAGVVSKIFLSFKCCRLLFFMHIFYSAKNFNA